MTDCSYNWEPSPHTADLAIAIRASNVEGLFHAALAGLLGILEFDATPPDEKNTIKHSLLIVAGSKENALVDFLNECIYLMEVENLVPVRLHSFEWREKDIDMVILCRGVIEEEKPEIGHVKAATYSDLEVVEVDGKFHAKIIFDT